MNIATIDDLSVIESIFAPYRKAYFPHIRQDYLKRKIEANNVILQDGVVIVFGVYKRKQKIGKVEAQKGDAHIGQIVTIEQGSVGAQGTAGAHGATGATGAQGAVGATGAQGAQGVQGSPGTLTLNEKSSNYTLVASDNSKIISITAAISITVPSGVFSAGDTVTIVNNTNATRSIVQGSGVTMYTAGTSTTGNKSLIQRGIATVICVSSDTFFISGAGLV